MSNHTFASTRSKLSLYRLLIGSIFFSVFLMLSGCSSGDNGGNGSDRITINNATFPSPILYPNLKQTVSLEITSPKDYSVENNDSEIFFFFAFDDLHSDAEAYWFDSTSFNELQEGTHTYTVDLIVPADINSSDYTFNVQVSDSDRVHDEYVSSGITILDHDDKPEIELISLTIDMEYGGWESEYDLIDSSEINSTAVSELGGDIPPLNVMIEEADEPLIISSSATIRSNLAPANDITVTTCLDIGSECIALPLLQVEDNTTVPQSLAEDDDNGTVTSTRTPVYLSQLNLGAFEANAEKTINLEFTVSVADIRNIVTDLTAQLLTNPSAVLDAELVVTIETPDESTLLPPANNTIRYPLHLALDSALSGDTATLPTFSPAHAPSLASEELSGECGLKKVELQKEYERYKYGERFGAGAYLMGKSWLDVEGVHGKVYSSIRIRRFSDTKWRILRTNLQVDIDPGSFEDTGYDIEISSLGTVIYTRSKSLADLTSLSTPTVTLTEEEKNLIGTKNTETNTTITDEATLLRQKRYKAAKKRLGEYTASSSTATTLISAGYNRRFAKEKKISKTIMFSIIPIVVTAGAEASVGFDADIRLDGLTSVTAELEPNAYIGAFLQAGVGAGVDCCGVDIEYSAGAGSNLWLLSERFTTTITADLSYVENDDYITQIDGNLHEQVNNYISTMNGETYAYARYWGPYNFNDPWDSDWKTRTRKKVFADWAGSRWESLLLNRQQTLFEIPIADECD